MTNKKLVAVFTAWPELVHDRHSRFNICFQEPCQQLIQNTFESTDVKGNLARYVAWAHDKKWHDQFDFCLFVAAPVDLELADFMHWMDEDYSNYIDPDQNFIFYHRKSVWNSKTFDVEKNPNPVGVIFIDCWQIIDNQSVWSEKSQEFDFYASMKHELLKYKIAGMVFHTGEFGNLPLADHLEPWRLLPNSHEIQHIEDFQRHYLAQNIYSWIVIGAHWQRCTHDKPLGFRNLLQLKTQDPALRIYSHQNCTVKFLNTNIANPVVDTLHASDYETDSLNWRPYGNLFELMC
jgi:hypothetical protein